MSVDFLVPRSASSATRKTRRRFMCDLLSERPTTGLITGDRIVVLEDGHQYQWAAGWTDLGAVLGGGGREVLTASRDYYVRTDGSDSNDGSADDAGHAFATVQYALDLVRDTIDFACSSNVVTIHVADGDYSAQNIFLFSMTNPQPGGWPSVFIAGNTADPSLVVFGSVGVAGTNTKLECDGLTVSGSLSATDGAMLFANDVKLTNAYGGAIAANNRGFVGVGGACELASSASSGTTFIDAYNHGIVSFGPSTFDITASYAIVTLGFIYFRWGGIVQYWPGTVTGVSNISGRKYRGYAMGMLSTNGIAPSSVPGTVAGDVDTGAVAEQLIYP